MSSRERYPEAVARDKASHPPELCSRFHQASELIGRRWTGAIIYVLMRTRCRFATLRGAIPDITDRMLSERLQELEEQGIVERTVIRTHRCASSTCSAPRAVRWRRRSTPSQLGRSGGWPFRVRLADHRPDAAN